MPHNRHLQNGVSIFNRFSKSEHCGHKYESTNHMHTAVNSYAPVRCLRMGAFCIALCENLFLLQLLICRFVHSLGEREKTLLCADRLRKEASEMSSQNERRIQNQFGGFCVRVLKNEANNIHREHARLREREKSLGELNAAELEQTATADKYFMGEHVFAVLGLPVVVAGDLLAEAIAYLPEDKRNVILLSYFVGLNDREISERISISRQAVTRRRNKTLKELREYLAREGMECLDE